MMKKRNKILSKILVMLISGGLGALAAKMGMGAATDMSASQIITLAILLLPAYLLVVAAHEAGHALAGVWPRELNKNDLNEALRLGNQLNAPMKVYLHSYLHQAALDEGDTDSAEMHLQDYLAEIESIPKGLRGMAHLDAAFFYAYARKDLEQAEKYWKQFVPSAMIPKAQVLATEAAIGKLKNEPDTDVKIEQALKQIPAMSDRGNGIALKEKLMHLGQTARF